MLRVGSYEARVRSMVATDERWIVATAVPQVRALLRMQCTKAHERSVAREWQLVGHAVVRALMPALRIVVAEIADAEPVLLGWRAEIDGELVYEYVARDYRSRGVGRAMRAFCKQREAA